jgi:hypothetical protein
MSKDVILDEEQYDEAVEPRMSEQAIEDFEESRKALFDLNDISQDQVDAWKAQYKDIGWTSFIMAGKPFAVVFVYRSITRTEWKTTVKPILLQYDDPDTVKEHLCSMTVLHPAEAQDPTFWDSAPALLPDTLEQLIMSVSGAEPQTTPMKL